MEILEVVGNVSDGFMTKVVAFLGIAGLVLITVEMFGTMFAWGPRTKFWASFSLGPAYAMLAYWCEMVDVKLHADDLSEMSTWGHAARHWVGVAFIGFLAVMLAKWLHDKGLMGKLTGMLTKKA